MKTSTKSPILQGIFLLFFVIVFASCTSKPVQVTESANVPANDYIATTTDYSADTSVPNTETEPIDSTSTDEAQVYADLTYTVSSKGIAPADSTMQEAVFIGQVTQDGQATIRPTPDNMTRIIVRDRNDSKGRTDSVFELAISDAFTLEASGNVLFEKYPNQNMYLIDITNCEVSNLVCHPGQIQPTVVAQEPPIVLATNTPATPPANDAAGTAVGVSLVAIAIAILSLL